MLSNHVVDRTSDSVSSSVHSSIELFLKLCFDYVFNLVIYIAHLVLFVSAFNSSMRSAARHKSSLLVMLPSPYVRIIFLSWDIFDMMSLLVVFKQEQWINSLKTFATIFASEYNPFPESVSNHTLSMSIFKHF